jgi:hypothetical protein
MALLVACLSQFPVVNDNVLALLCAPFFVVKLFLLLCLTFHPLDDLSLSS